MERSKESVVYISLTVLKLKLFGKTTKSKAMVRYFTKMAIILKVPLIFHRKKEKGYTNGTNWLNIKESSRKIASRDRDISNLEITNFTRVKLREVKEKEWATTSMSMEMNLRENGETMRSTQEITSSSQAILFKADLKMENCYME